MPSFLPFMLALALGVDTTPKHDKKTIPAPPIAHLSILGQVFTPDRDLVGNFTATSVVFANGGIFYHNDEDGKLYGVAPGHIVILHAVPERKHGKGPTGRQAEEKR